jgi:ribulose-phosphate 3-epimerase
MVLLMTVNPGFGGQEFIQGSYAKIRKLRALITETGSPALIQVDGGVDLENASSLVGAGVNVLVAGNTIFKADDPATAIKALKECHRKFV